MSVDESTKVKVGFVAYKYHWESYSVVRSLWENLQERSELELLWLDKVYNKEEVDVVFMVGAYSYTPRNIEVPVIRFGFSDPNLYREDDKGDLYCTNDLETSKEKNHYYFPCYADKKYFKQLHLKKETDILFIGAKKHPFIPDREKVVNRLRQDGFNVKCFGTGWENGYIEGDELVSEYNKARICLDITTKSTALGSRVFQSSMCGTPVLSRYREDTDRLFENTVLYYSNYNELIEILRHLDINYLERVGMLARRRCLERHDISMRVNDLMEVLNDKSLLRPILS